MLHLIESHIDPYYPRLLEDPVRPEIPSAQRLGHNRSVFAWVVDQSLAALLCCQYRDTVPSAVDQLFSASTGEDTAIFYTIWSYHRGAGQALIRAARAWIIENRPEIRQFITLSPCTDMARRFHLGNGAGIYRINSDSVNYIYE